MWPVSIVKSIIPLASVIIGMCCVKIATVLPHLSWYSGNVIMSSDLLSGNITTLVLTAAG